MDSGRGTLIEVTPLARRLLWGEAGFMKVIEEISWGGAGSSGLSVTEG